MVTEFSLLIGIVPCANARCPAPFTDLGEILFVGKYEPQALSESPLNTFESITFVVPREYLWPSVYSSPA